MQHRLSKLNKTLNSLTEQYHRPWITIVTIPHTLHTNQHKLTLELLQAHNFYCSLIFIRGRTALPLRQKQRHFLITLLWLTTWRGGGGRKFYGRVRNYVFQVRRRKIKLSSPQSERDTLALARVMGRLIKMSHRRPVWTRRIGFKSHFINDTVSRVERSDSGAT